jgi:hypothetical protein
VSNSFTIRFSASDADTSDTVSVRLFYDTDTNPATGLTEITSTPLAGSATQFVWNTLGVPSGTYYIYAQASDGRDTRGAYSTGPIVVSGPQSDAHLAMDAPANGASVGASFTVSGWALDRAASSGTGIDQVHVYGYPNPGSGTPPVFLGAATYGSSRPDIGGIFGSQFTNSGYTLSVSNVAGGQYQVTAFGRSTVTNTFSVTASAIVNVSGPVSRPAVALDGPLTNSTVGATVNFVGWAIDLGASAGTGVDAVHVYAYPQAGGAAMFLGVATYGQPRPDVGAAFGSPYANSGFRLTAPVSPPGVYRIVAFAHSTVANAFNAAATADNVTVQSTNTNATVFVDSPVQNSVRSRPFTLSGWAVDAGASSGTGIDAVHVWAFPTSGAAATLVGVANYGLSRPDIGALYNNSRFTPSGFTFQVTTSNLPAGTYDLVVFGHSTVTNGFTVARVVRVTVQ